jgi:hypothetical protein
MKKYFIACAIASSALFALSAQAAPAASDASGIKGQVGGSAEKVWHCRRWSGGWGCGGGGHSRYWSHRRHGSWGW